MFQTTNQYIYILDYISITISTVEDFHQSSPLGCRNSIAQIAIMITSQSLSMIPIFSSAQSSLLVASKCGA